MKKICFLIFVCSMLGCTKYTERENLQECRYIDYMTCPEENITPQDRFLLDHVDFQEGELVCSLDADAVAEQGISEQKYAYFLEYLQNKNREIKVDLDSGKIVVYNGKPFTKNEKLYQYIEMPDQVQTKATEYGAPVLLRSVELTMPHGMASLTNTYSFIGVAKIVIVAGGRGKFDLFELDKGFNISLYCWDYMGSNEATFKWGGGNKVGWRWRIKYTANSGEAGRINFYGLPEKKAPAPTDEGYLYWHNDLPSDIHVCRDYDIIHLIIKRRGSFTVYLLQKIGIDYIERSRWQNVPPGEDLYWYGNEYDTYHVVIYEEIKDNGKIFLEYVGDIELRPYDMEGMPYE